MMPPRCDPFSSSQRRCSARSSSAACGTEGIQLSDDDPDYTGAVLFAERCSGCHTLDGGGDRGVGQPRAAQPGPEPRRAGRELRGRPLRDSATAASPARSCRRTSSSARRPRPSPSSSPPTPAARSTARRSPATTSEIESEEQQAARRGRVAPERLVLDLRAIREDPGPAREALARRGAAEALDELLALDARRRELLPEVEGRRAAQNEASDQIAARKRAGEDAAEVIERMKGVSAELKRMQAELAEVEERRDALAATLPNLPDPEAPDGGEDDAVSPARGRRAAPVRVRVSRPPRPRPRARLDRDREGGRGLGLALRLPARRPGDGRAGAGSGSRSTPSAREGFEPVVPPVLVREGPLFGTGFFPGEREMIYEVERDELFLVGTSEVSLAALHAGRDPRRRPSCRGATPGSQPASAARPAPPARTPAGIFRVHQFDKVEMFSFVSPDEGRAPSTSGSWRSRSGS